MELKKNQEILLTIEDFTREGEGLGKYQGFPLFVKDTVIGDTGEDVITIWGDGSGSSQDSQLTQEQMEILNQIPEALP